MAKNKHESKDIEKELKKLKPVEIKESEIKPKKEIKEEKKSEELGKSGENEQEHQRISQFSERILSEASSSKFTAPILTPKEQKAGSLEETAARAPSASISPAAESKTDYAPSSLSYSGSGAYEKKDRDKYRRSENARPMLLMDEGRKADIPSAFSLADSQRARMSAAKSAEQAQMDEFAKQQERYRLERQESTSLPFQRKGASRRKTEIF